MRRLLGNWHPGGAERNVAALRRYVRVPIGGSRGAIALLEIAERPSVLPLSASPSLAEQAVSVSVIEALLSHMPARMAALHSLVSVARFA